MPNLAAAKASTQINKTLSFTVGKARGVSIIVAVVIVAVVVIVVIVVVVIAGTIVVIAAHVLFPTIEAFMHIMELNANVVDFHWCGLRG